MRSGILYFHIHQPPRVREYSIFDVGNRSDYFSNGTPHSRINNQLIFEKVAEKSYRPMLKLLEDLLNQHQSFQFSLSITGTFLEQAEKWGQDIVETLKRLVATGRVEIVAETYYHSLAFFFSKPEFERQVKQHQAKIKELFGVESRIFRNTELSYNDDLAAWAEDFGFDGILAEGWDKVLRGRSPNFIYRPANTNKIKLLLKNYRLSDDVAFRFSDKNWAEFPLTVEKYLAWMEDSALSGPLINLFMDFETFGEHQWADTGIFQFFEQFVGRFLENPENNFLTVSNAVAQYEAIDEISMPETVTWADTERDLSAWLGNSMQHEAAKNLYEIEKAVLATKNQQLIDDWRNLQTSDHLYYMCTKYWNDGDVHAYFSAYESPYDAFLYFMNAMRDVEFRSDT
ncbi:MAG: glycoside hydrolase family 57 protein [Candidatus Nomurabacteria bacterium]|nr:glycoside hydrolase family 57 protein [Candidatus Nomurabacteria bacterium]